MAAEARLVNVDHVAAASYPSILGAILDPAISLAIWRRQLSSPLADFIAHADLANFSGLRLTVALSDMPQMLSEALQSAGMSALGASVLGTDIVHLARLYADAVDHDRLDVRLDRITGNACHKFHADYVRARLISTYRGPATQWLEQGAGSDFQATGRVPEDAIRSLETGDVALLKGRLWSPEDALVHRSPPIAGSGEDRLLLVINQVEDETALP